jgi:hypothetical protein
VTITPQIWNAFTDYKVGRNIDRITIAEAIKLYEDGVEIAWKLGDAVKIYILVVKQDIEALYGFDWRNS